VPDDPTRPYEGFAEPDPLVAQLQRGVRLFEQLRQIDSASGVIKAVNEGGLDEPDLRAIVLARVFSFRQESESSDDYSAVVEPIGADLGGTI
jgi:hypothetical protein